MDQVVEQVNLLHHLSLLALSRLAHFAKGRLLLQVLLWFHHSLRLLSHGILRAPAPCRYLLSLLLPDADDVLHFEHELLKDIVLVT